jgi:hypothetical protein
MRTSRGRFGTISQSSALGTRNWRRFPPFAGTMFVSIHFVVNACASAFSFGIGIHSPVPESVVGMFDSGNQRPT